MPSLRRSFSSPNVRSSPYPSSAAPRARPQPRRPSPTTTAERRVLADIDWWRVHDGQCDFDEHARDDPHELDQDVSPGGTLTLSAGGGAVELLQMHSFTLDSTLNVYPSALSIAPYSPPGSSHGRDSSPELTPETPSPSLEHFRFGDLFPSSPTRAGGRQAHPLFGLRSVSAPALSRQGFLVPDFADMGGDSFSLDQNLFQ